METKLGRSWCVTFYKDGKIIGPPWEVVSKIKPTKWANEHVWEGCSYLIEEVAQSEGEQYS